MQPEQHNNIIEIIGMDAAIIKLLLTGLAKFVLSMFFIILFAPSAQSPLHRPSSNKSLQDTPVLTFRFRSLNLTRAPDFLNSNQKKRKKVGFMKALFQKQIMLHLHSLLFVPGVDLSA